jgi:Flp pilus assembly protein TadG
MSGADRGSATAELAVGLPALILFLVVGLGAIGVATTKAQCVDAARDAALAAARGESTAAAGSGCLPRSGSVVVTVVGDTVRARASARVRPLGGLLPGLVVSAEAVAAIEPGQPESPR